MTTSSTTTNTSVSELSELTTAELFAQIKAHAEANQVHHTVILTPDDMTPCTYVPQGDLNLIFLAKSPSSIEPMEVKDGQLAPGTSRGSRHIISAESMPHVQFFKVKQATALNGPVLFLKPNTVTELTHPEHKHIIFQTGDEGQWMAVGYQCAHAEELRRQAD